MSGGGALETGGKSRRGGSNRKKKKRLGFVLDMTPLVDITFLLLTFFMFTTTMLKPQVMEMKIPQATDEIQVIDDHLLSIFVDDDEKIYWFLATDEPKEISINKIQNMAKIQNLNKEVRNKLITVLKVSNKAKYETLVRILDELNLAETEIATELFKETDPETGEPLRRKRKFTLAPLNEADYKKLHGEENNEENTNG